ncbi:hypothetical protein KM043_005762 [Ampulex compressa]|nr:hypothetical protein KM043_005762 [Ampulex compressa]
MVEIGERGSNPGPWRGGRLFSKHPSIRLDAPGTPRSFRAHPVWGESSGPQCACARSCRCPGRDLPASLSLRDAGGGDRDSTPISPCSDNIAHLARAHLARTSGAQFLSN